MKIIDILNKKKFIFSMEIFPPKPEYDISKIYKTIDGLIDLKPDFISVTYGAGGSTRTRTIEIAENIIKKYNVPSLAHLTCIEASKENISKILYEMKSKNIENILALRGDLPDSKKNYFLDFKYASDLIKFIKSNNDWDFCIGVAGYPEKHPEAKSLDEDIEHLKEKIDSGADFIITQLFLDNEYFFRYYEKVRNAGINVPVIPGIMTATKIKNLEKMAEKCNVNIPDKFKKATLNSTPELDICEDTIKYTVGQINHLIKNGVKAIHLYTMNKVEQNKRIYLESKLKELRKNA